MTEFRAIMFDWGGVFTPNRVSARATRDLEIRLKVQPGTLSKLLYENEFWTRAQTGLITDAEFWRLTLKQFGIENDAEIARFKAALFRGERSTIRSGMTSLVKRLRARYTVALLTNADDLFADVLRTKFQVDGMFDQVIISAEVGVAKPDLDIYLVACRKLQIPANECIFIDDSPANVGAAQLIGMKAIEYTTTKSVAKELKEFGVVLS